MKTWLIGLLALAFVVPVSQTGAFNGYRNPLTKPAKQTAATYAFHEPNHRGGHDANCSNLCDDKRSRNLERIEKHYNNNIAYCYRLREGAKMREQMILEANCVRAENSKRQTYYEGVDERERKCMSKC